MKYLCGRVGMVSRSERTQRLVGQGLFIGTRPSQIVAPSNRGVGDSVIYVR